MISYIKGTVEYVRQSNLVVENGGIGYCIYVSNITLSKVKKGETIKIYTYMNVKEDGITLYGFLTIEELNMFNLLITVSGVGPKAALMILSGLTPAQIALAIITDDCQTLSKCQGVGKKTAQRITLELRDKIKTEDAVMSNIADAQQSLEFSGNDGAVRDAVEALIALGFSKSEAVKACMDVTKDGMSVEQILKAALKKINTK